MSSPRVARAPRRVLPPKASAPPKILPRISPRSTSPKSVEKPPTPPPAPPRPSPGGARCGAGFRFGGGFLIDRFRQFMRCLGQRFLRPFHLIDIAAFERILGFGECAVDLQTLVPRNLVAVVFEGFFRRIDQTVQ